MIVYHKNIHEWDKTNYYYTHKSIKYEVLNIIIAITMPNNTSVHIYKTITLHTCEHITFKYL